MPRIAQQVARATALRVARPVNGYGHVSFLEHSLAFANASPRYAINPVTGAVTGPYAAGEPAIVSIGGERYLQCERAITGINRYSQHIPSWDTRVGVTVTKTTDPLGGLTADLIIENTDSTTHKAYNDITGTGTVNRITTRFVKRYGSSTRWFDVQSGVIHCLFDIVNGVWGTLGVGSANHFIRVLPNGWFRIGFSTLVAPTGLWQDVILARGNTPNDMYVGDPTQGLIVWQQQLQESTPYATSPILTTSAAVTRAKDEAYIPAVSVPTALKDRCQFSVYPEWSSAQVTTGDLRYLGEFADTTQNIKIYYNGTDKKIYVYGASALITSAATTHSANQKLTVHLDRVAGTVTLGGFTTGNGVTTGTAWDRTDGALYVGMDATLANQFDGLVSVGGALT